MLDDLLSEVKAREDMIENLTSKLNITDQRQREYREVFGSVGQLEEKLKKMDQLYSDKLRSCFDHYSRTIGTVNQECKRISLISDRLKESQISSSKASSNLAAISTNLESQINCFEKFFNKFSSVSDLNLVVESYNKNKQEAKKGINRVIYLEELAKFKERSKQNSPTEKIRTDYLEKIETMGQRFQGFHKTAQTTPELPQGVPSSTNLLIPRQSLGSSQTKFNFKKNAMNEAHMRDSAKLKQPLGTKLQRLSQLGSKSSFRLTHSKTSQTLKPTPGY
jgi:hypothetical protein